jgi:hypothetical protein
MPTNYNDVFLNALNISPKDATPFGTAPSSTIASPNYNALLWKKIYTDRTMTSASKTDGGYPSFDPVTDDGSFFVIATFNSTSSIKGNDIYSYLNGSGLGFDQYGNIKFGSSSWSNPLFNPPKPFSSTKTVSSSNLDRVMSSSGKWILFRDQQLSKTGDQIYYLLYNPIHAKSYNSYYNGLQTANSKDLSKSLSDPLPQKYCEMMATKPNNANTTSNIHYQQHDWSGGFKESDINGPGGPYSPGSDGNRNYADVLCNGIYNRECVNYATGSQISVSGGGVSGTALNQNCDCMSDLRQKSITDHGDSFISKFIIDSHSQKNGGVSTCPTSLEITTCSQIINSAGSFNAKDSNFNQICGSKPHDCEYSPVTWGKCDPSSGIQTGTKTVTSLGFAGGKDCEGGENGNQGRIGTVVQVTQPCAVDCVMSDWVNQGTCSTSSATCGGGPGLQSQTRNVVTLPKNGGAACGATIQNIQCSLPPCTTNTPTSAPTSAPTSPSIPPSTPSSSPSTEPTTSPTGTNNTTMILGAVGVAVVGLGIYFYLSSSAAIIVK